MTSSCMVSIAPSSGSVPTGVPSLIIGPEGVVPEMLPEARKRNADRVAGNKGHEFDSHENRPLSERCILLNQERIPLIPGANEGNLIQIVRGLDT